MLDVNMCWECPKCSTQVATADTPTTITTLHPPFCSLFHQTTEMEQRTAERWGRQFEDGNDAADR